MWVWSGLVLSLLLAAVAWWRSKAPAPTYYEEEVYGLTALSHRRWAGLFAILALAAAVTATWARGAGALALLSALTLAGILYGASFVRGASGEDE